MRKVIATIACVALLSGCGPDKAAPIRFNPHPTAQVPATYAPPPTVYDYPDEDASPAAGPILTTDNIELSLKTTEKQCFGSAGCIVKVKVEAGWDSTLSPDETWEVTYEITGDESGPIVGSFDVTGQQYDVNTENLSTKSKSTKIRIKVTSVDKLGI